MQTKSTYSKTNFKSTCSGFPKTTRLSLQWSSDHPSIIIKSSSSELGDILSWNIQTGLPSRRLITDSVLRKQYLYYQLSTINRLLQKPQYQNITVIFLQECDHGLIHQLKQEIPGFQRFLNSSYQQETGFHYGTYGNVTYVREKAFRNIELTSDYSIGVFGDDVPVHMRGPLPIEILSYLTPHRGAPGKPIPPQYQELGVVTRIPNYFRYLRQGRHPSTEFIRNGAGPFNIYYDKDRYGNEKIMPDKNMALDVRVTLFSGSQVILRNIHTYAQAPNLTAFHFAIKPSLGDRHLVVGGDFNLNYPTLKRLIQDEFPANINTYNSIISDLSQEMSDFTIPGTLDNISQKQGEKQGSIQVAMGEVRGWKSAVDGICLLSLFEQDSFDSAKYSIQNKVVFPDDERSFFHLNRYKKYQEAQAQADVRKLIAQQCSISDFRASTDTCIYTLPC